MTPLAAFASEWDISLMGGESLATGKFAATASDSTGEGAEARNGPSMGIDICMHVNEAFAVGVDGSLNKFKHKGEGDVFDLGGGATLTATKDRYKVVQFGVHGKYMFKTSGKIVPYAMLGLGIYNMKENYEYTYYDGVVTQVFTEETDSLEQPGSRFGGKLGAGATYMVSPTLGLGLSADFNHTSLNKDKFGISSVEFWAIRARITYHLMKK